MASSQLPLLLLLVAANSAASAPPVKGGYWFSGSLPFSAIDTSYFTHVYYAFLLPDSATYELVVSDADDQTLPKFTAALHSKCPPAKAILSIGGGDSDPEVFSKIAGEPSARDAFIQSAVGVARGYGFDGMDLDWELPANQTDMDNLGLLFREWRAAIAEEAAATGKPPLLLTAAVHYSATVYGDRAYPRDAIAECVDWVNAMCYDYHGSWERPPRTGAHAALYDPTGDLSTSYGVQSWLELGVPPGKIIMGLPLYGRSWTLMDPQVNGLGSPATGVGPGHGALAYKQIVDLNRKNEAIVIYDGPTVSVYSYWGTSWVGYDNERSVTEKIMYAKRHKLGGYFFWAIPQDKDWAISRVASNLWASTCNLNV